MGQVLLELTKTLAWPVVALVVLVLFWKPLHKAANMLPSLLEASESIQLGSVSLQLRKQFARKLAEDVRKVLIELNADDLRDILARSGDEGTTIEFSGENNLDELRFKRYVNLGLAVQLSNDELDRLMKQDETRTERANSGVRLTALYFRTYDFLVNLLPELVERYNTDEIVRRK